MPPEKRAPEQRIPIPDPPPGSEVIDIVFNVARGRIPREQPQIRIEGFLQDVGRESSSPSNVLRLRRSAGERARRREGSIPGMNWITVRGQGETPELVKIVYRGKRPPEFRPLEPREENDQVLAVYAPAPSVCVGDADFLLSVVPTTPQPGVGSSTPTPDNYVTDLDTLLTGAPNTPTTRYREYFAKLNRRTHPALIKTLPIAELSVAGQADRIDWIGWLVSILHDRVVNRGNAYKTNSADPWTQAVEDGIDKIKQLSTIQLQTAAEFFVGADGLWDGASFREAYEMFANGELRLQLPTWAWTTQPSSGYFFFFGEFALLAMDNDVDADRWRVLAPALVRAQRVFARVFAPANAAQATFSSYRGCNYDPLQVYSASALGQLVVDYPYATEADLRIGAGANAKEFLPGELT